MNVAPAGAKIHSVTTGFYKSGSPAASGWYRISSTLSFRKPEALLNQLIAVLKQRLTPMALAEVLRDVGRSLATIQDADPQLN